MANLLEYVVSVREKAANMMQKLGSSAQNVSNKLQGMQHESVLVASALRELGAPIDKLKQQLDKLKQERGLIHQRDISQIRQFNTEIKNLERQIHSLENVTSQSKLSGWAKEAFSQIPFAGLLTNPLVVAGAIAGASIKKGIEQDLQNTSFEVLLGGKDAAKKMVDEIAEYGKNTPYDKMGVGENAKQLLGFQISAEKVMPVLRAIGDVAMGDKNKMNSLTLAFAQMSSAGKLNGQDLNQMINAGFNPLGEIAKKTGKSIAQLKDEMAKGKISAKMVEEAFMSATSEGGAFYKMAEKMGKTLGGKLAQFMDNIAEKLLIIYEVIGPVIEKLIEFGGAVLDATFNGIKWLVDKVKEGNPFFLALAGVVGVVTLSLMLVKSWMVLTTVWSGIMTVKNNLLSKSWWKLNAAMLANPATWITAAIILLIGYVATAIYYFDDWGSTMLTLMGPIGQLITGIVLIARHWDSIVDAFKSEGILAGFKRIGQVLLDTVMHPLERILGWVGELMNWDWAKQAQKDVNDFRKSLNLVTIQETQEKKPLWQEILDKIGLGIKDPELSGAAIETDINTKDKDNKDKSNTAVATGGTKHNYITINLNDLIGVLNINKSGFKESTDEMQEQATDALLRLLGSAVSAGN